MFNMVRLNRDASRFMAQFNAHGATAVAGNSKARIDSLFFKLTRLRNSGSRQTPCKAAEKEGQLCDSQSARSR